MSHDSDEAEDTGVDDGSVDSTSNLPADFRAVVTAALQDRGYAIAGWEADGVNVTPPGKAPDHYIGLSNLYRRARAVDPAAWPGMIHDFLSHLISGAAAPQIPDDLMTIAGRLRPRLGRPFSRAGRVYPWGIPLPGTGLEINLVVDYPHTMAYVTDEMLRKACRSGEDLLDIALANLRAATPSDYFEPVSADLDIWIGHCGDGYDAARALLIEDILPGSPAGFWVAIPTREELVVWPVSYAALERIHVIRLYAQDNFRRNPYPVTEDVFWVHEGTWYPFGIRVEADGVTVSPPEQFLVALAGSQDAEQGRDAEAE